MARGVNTKGAATRTAKGALHHSMNFYGDEVSAQVAEWRTGIYVRIHGKIREFDNKKSIMAFQVRLITDFNEVRAKGSCASLQAVLHLLLPPAHACLWLARQCGVCAKLWTCRDGRCRAACAGDLPPAQVRVRVCALEEGGRDRKRRLRRRRRRRRRRGADAFERCSAPENA